MAVHPSYDTGLFAGPIISLRLLLRPDSAVGLSVGLSVGLTIHIAVSVAGNICATLGGTRNGLACVIFVSSNHTTLCLPSISLTRSSRVLTVLLISPSNPTPSPPSAMCCYLNASSLASSFSVLLHTASVS